MRWGAALDTPAGVHIPSAFSAVLAACLPDLTGQVVLDAGCGAGLISIAALLRGAEQVIACDIDPAALSATHSNVNRVAVNTDRLTLLHSDFRALGHVSVDLALANPPQRPDSVLQATPVAERHLHRGGGTDGMDVIKLLLDHLPCPRLWTTAASTLPVQTLSTPEWQPPQLVQRLPVPLQRPWSATETPSDGEVIVWSFNRTTKPELTR